MVGMSEKFTTPLSTASSSVPLCSLISSTILRNFEDILDCNYDFYKLNKNFSENLAQNGQEVPDNTLGVE